MIEHELHHGLDRNGIAQFLVERKLVPVGNVRHVALIGAARAGGGSGLNQGIDGLLQRCCGAGFLIGRNFC